MKMEVGARGDFPFYGDFYPIPDSDDDANGCLLTDLNSPVCQVYDDPPHSCQQGICTTCAGLIRSGVEGIDYKVAVDALDPSQKAEVSVSAVRVP